MKGRDVVNWIKLYPDFVIPAALFVVGVLLGAFLF